MSSFKFFDEKQARLQARREKDQNEDISYMKNIVAQNTDKLKREKAELEKTREAYSELLQSQVVAKKNRAATFVDEKLASEFSNLTKIRNFAQESEKVTEQQFLDNRNSQIDTQQECLAQRRAQKDQRIEEALKQDRDLILGYVKSNAEVKRSVEEKQFRNRETLKKDLESQILEREQRIHTEASETLDQDKARVQILEQSKQRALDHEESQRLKKKAFQENLFLSQYLETSE